MLEYYKHYSLGKKTFFFFWVHYSWWMTILGLALLYAGISIFIDGRVATFYSYLSTSFPSMSDQRVMYLELLFASGFSFFLLGFLRAFMMYNQYKFYLDKDALHYKEGIFRTKEIRIPYMQISNVEIDRPYHFRMVGLARVDIITNMNNQLFDTKKHNRKHLMPMIDGKRARHLAKHIIKHSTGGPRSRQNPNVEEEEYEETE